MDDFKQVELRVSTEVNGRKVQARARVELELWNVGVGYQDRMKAALLRSLADEIVKGLAPEVEVVMPGPTLHEAIVEALEPYTYPYGKNGL